MGRAAPRAGFSPWKGDDGQECSLFITLIRGLRDRTMDGDGCILALQLLERGMAAKRVLLLGPSFSAESVISWKATDTPGGLAGGG